jgi:uncharacterized protein (DUF1330 family)
MTIVAILIVRRPALEDFRAFERHAAGVMAAHGGRIERAVVTPVAGAPDLVREIHVVTFPDAAAFQAYREDPRLTARAHLREAAVVSTEVFVGQDGPDYGVGEPLDRGA